jgi:preprotein translocase subunit SecG
LVAIWLILTLALAYLYKNQNATQIFDIPEQDTSVLEIPVDEVPVE